MGDNTDTDIIKTLDAVQKSLTAINIDVGSWVSGFNWGNAILYGLFWLGGWTLTLVISGMVILSTFVSIVIQALCAIVFPTLIWSKTRGIFFAWGKLYISLSLYAPFAIFCSLIAKEAANYAANTTANNYEGLESFTSIVAVTILYAFSIFILLKIPSWINQLIGSSNDSDSMGAGSVIKTTAGLAGNLSKGIGLASKFGGMMMGNLGNSIGKGAAGIGKGVGKMMENAIKNPSNPGTIGF